MLGAKPDCCKNVNGSCHCNSLKLALQSSCLKRCEVYNRTVLRAWSLHVVQSESDTFVCWLDTSPNHSKGADIVHNCQDNRLLLSHQCTLGNVLGNYISSRGAAEGHNQWTGCCVVWKYKDQQTQIYIKALSSQGPIIPCT